MIIHRTGDVHDLAPSFLYNVARVSTFITEVSAIAATRAARNILSGDWAKRRQPRIAFLPHRPGPWYAIWSVCRLSRINIVDDPLEADLLFYFEDREFLAGTSHLPKNMVNGRCTDIRKSRVADVFEDVFGYSLSVDPLTHDGPMVVKSEGNGVHDGRIENGPVQAKSPHAVYQRLIEPTDDGVMYTDHRTQIVGGKLSVVFIKKRHRDIRFSNDNDDVSIALPGRVFSRDEQTKIRTFANRMGLDFGGMDVLRDRHDGRLYIVDVNKTDLGPPISMPHRLKRPVMQRLARDFRAYVDSQIDLL